MLANMWCLVAITLQHIFPASWHLTDDLISAATTFWRAPAAGQFCSWWPAMGLQYVDLQIMLRIIGELCGKKRWRAALINNPLIYWSHFSLLSQSQTQLIFRINHCRHQQCAVWSAGRQCELMARFKMFSLSKESHGRGAWCLFL